MSDNTFSQSAEVFSGPLQQLIEMGGPVIVVLLVLAVAGLITFLYLLLTGAVYAPRLPRRLKRILDDWHHVPDRKCIERILAKGNWFQRQNPLRHMMAETMATRLEHHEPDVLRETLGRDARSALEPFEAPLKIIEVIAALAPLLGLLGTVLGMMDAFGAMAATEGRANASQLSGGIYEALTTTAAGLIVAIPFAALAAWIEFRLRKLNNLVNATLVTILAPAIELPETIELQEEGQIDDAEDALAAPPEAKPMTAPTRIAHAAG